jgi:hypothetical protein
MKNAGRAIVPSEDLEKMWREMVLAELKELNESQKKLIETINNEVLRRLQTLEHLVIGVDGKNGLRSRTEKLEKGNDKNRIFRIQLITIVTVVQVIGGVILTLVLKFL